MFSRERKFCNLNRREHPALPGFYEAFFEEIPGLKSIAEIIFLKKYRAKDNPLYSEEGG
jgi:hypothetical protein